MQHNVDCYLSHLTNLECVVNAIRDTCNAIDFNMNSASTI